MSRILSALAQIDAERDFVEADLRRQVAELKVENTAQFKLIQEATSLSSRRHLAIALMIGYLREQGLSREQIDRLTAGNLDLGEGSENDR